jgi:hypothetical protein
MVEELALEEVPFGRERAISDDLFWVSAEGIILSIGLTHFIIIIAQMIKQ